MFSKLIQMYVCVTTSTLYVRSVFSDRSILTSLLQLKNMDCHFWWEAYHSLSQLQMM